MRLSVQTAGPTEEALDRLLVPVMRDDSDVAVVISKEIENGLEGCIAVRVEDAGVARDIGKALAEITHFAVRLYSGNWTPCNPPQKAR